MDDFGNAIKPMPTCDGMTGTIPPPPTDLPPLPWPAVCSLRHNSAEQRIANLERTVSQLERTLHRVLNGTIGAESDA